MLTSITPGKLRQLENPQNLLRQRKRTFICIKDVVPSPKRSTRLNLTLKSSRTIKTSSRKHRINKESVHLPSFLFDFLDEERPQAPKPQRDQLNFQESSPLRPKIRVLSNGHIPESDFFDQEDKFPELSMQKIMEKRNCKTSNGRNQSMDCTSFYKPYVVEITPRSSVTLYGIEPLDYRNLNTSSSPKRHRNLAKVINMRNITTEKYKKNENYLQPVVISFPAKSFAEKLKRVQDIAKEAEDSFNML